MSLPSSRFAFAGAIFVGVFTGFRALPEHPASAGASPAANAVVAVTNSVVRPAGEMRPVALESAPPAVPRPLDGDWDQAVLPTRQDRAPATPSPTEVPAPTFTPAPWAIPYRDSAADPARRPMVVRDPRNGATRFDPASLPQTVLGVGFAGPDLTAKELLTGVAPRAGEPASETAWAVEVVYATDERFDEKIAEDLLAEHARGFRIILRIDYARKVPVPPSDDPEAVERYTNAFLRWYDLTRGTVRYFIVGNEGNVDSAGVDPSRVTECLAGREACKPESYVQVYRRVRAALRSRTDAYVLVGAPSPGGTRDSMRWAEGTAYMTHILGLLHPLEVDGVTLHAYGGAAAPAGSGPVTPAGIGLDEFTGALDDQIKAVADAGLVSTPIFLTEMNQLSAPNPDFIRGAHAWIDQHNRRSPQDIVSASWFVYYDEMDQWREYALEGRYDVLPAFRAAAGLPPGR